MAEKKTEIRALCSEEFKKALKIMCAVEGKTISEVIIKALEPQVKKYMELEDK